MMYYSFFLAIFDSYHKTRRDIHAKLTEECVDILTAYRTNCAASTSAGQLILPEAFKLLPVYAHGAMRSLALRGGKYFMSLYIYIYIYIYIQNTHTQHININDNCFYKKK